MSTQDRAIRGAEAGEHEAEAEGAVASGGLDPARMRVMQRRWVQRKAGGAGGGGGGAAAIPEGGGAPLGGKVQSRMERTLGADLSGVRVHTGGDSATAADALGARAFTVGSDVHFGRGEFAPGSREGDRLLAHELAHVVQGQKSGVQRKAAHGDSDAGDGDHQAGGHEVSEPGDAAEHEADAAGDHAADALHGDSDKGGGEHDAADADSDAGGKGGADKAGASSSGGKKVASAPKPKLTAAAPDVGRKIMRAKKPAAPAAAAPAAGPTSTTAGPAGAQNAKTADAPKPLPPQAALRVQSISKSLDKDAADKLLGVAVKSSPAEVEQLAKDYPDEVSVKELKAKLVAKRAEIETKFQEAMKAAGAAVAKIDATNPAHWSQLDTLSKDPAISNWFNHPLFPNHELVQAFVKARDAKSTEFAENKRTALDKAKQAIKGAPDKTESRAVIQAILDGAKPYIQDRSPYYAPNVVQLQEAFSAKLGGIGDAERVEKEKQENAAKQLQQQQEQQKAQAAGGKPGDAKAAAATQAAPAANAKHASTPSSSAATTPAATSAAPAAKPHDQKKPDGDKKPEHEHDTAAASSGAKTPTAAQKPASSAVPTPAAAQAPAPVEPPKPAGPPPPQAAETTLKPAEAAMPAGDEKKHDSSVAKMPAPETGSAAKPADAPTAQSSTSTAAGPSKTTDAAKTDPSHAQGSSGALAPQEDPAAKELELKKELAKARIHEYAAKIKGRMTVFSGVMEIGNALMTVVKAFGGMHGVELPEDVISIGKDGLQSFLKMEGLSVEVQAALAEAEVDSMESIAKLDQLFDDAEVSYTQHVSITTRAEAMYKRVREAVDAKLKAAAGAGKKPTEKSHAAEPEAEGAKPGEEKRDEEHGLGDTFNAAMEENDAKENADLGGYKQMVNNAAVVMDPLKAIKAGLEIKTELKSMAQAKRDAKKAKEELEQHLAHHGGSALLEDLKDK